MYVHTHTHTVHGIIKLPSTGVRTPICQTVRTCTYAIYAYVHTYVLEPGTDYVVDNTTNMVGQLAAVTSVAQELNFPTITRC